jgi:3',5'-cyclic AMP phosphodiesterase CpdA
MFTLAHLSDLHLPPPAANRWRDLACKRILGYISYSLKRKMVHDREVIAALVDDLRQQAPDHVAITGDLTNIALPEEFATSARWLHALGAQDAISVIPGNHDAYVAVPWRRSLGHWASFMSDPRAPMRSEADFPFVRRRGPIALIGVSSAFPCPTTDATGRVGKAQLARLATVLERLRGQSLRVVLIHHPPIAGMMAHRKRLIDQVEFRAVIEESGAELILHGHHHLFSQAELATPTGQVPVFGVPSASALHHPGRQHAGYHVYRLRLQGSAEAASWRLEVEVRGLTQATGRFVTERHFELTIANARRSEPVCSIADAAQALHS